MGFTSQRILRLMLGEAVSLSLAGGLVGALAAGLMILIGHSSRGLFVATSMRVTLPTVLVAAALAAFAGFISTLFSSYYASRKNIVEGLRHIG
jgi:ABC-type antimicrobial peptide transport system permease subunit